MKLTLDHMPPTESQNYFASCGLRDPELRTKMGLFFTSGISSSNFAHLLFCQFRQMVLFPSLPSFRMFSGSVLISPWAAFRVLSWSTSFAACLPSLSISVSQILLMSTKPQMSGIHACPNVASVANTQSVRDLSVMNDPRNAMCSLRSISLMTAIRACRTHTVSTVVKTTSPNPATVFWSIWNLLPKSVDVQWSHLDLRRAGENLRAGVDHNYTMFRFLAPGVLQQQPRARALQAKTQRGVNP